VAWGIVDGVMYVLAIAAERARSLNFDDAVRNAPLPEARHTFLGNLPEEVCLAVSDAEAEALLLRIRDLPANDPLPIVNLTDLWAAVSILVLVAASTLPPSMPFLFIDDLPTAMRVSNAIALVMLFTIGARLGKYMGRSPWPMAVAMTAIGSILVAVTIAFGG
jgi:VIT1/CCC1 family predicted Fe2+/Mn2+ transporter